MSQLCNCIEVKTSYNLIKSGFCKVHSTSTLLLKIKDDIIHAVNTSEVTVGILLDFSKECDTIDHLTLLQKLYKVNFSAEALKLIQSYISERQYIQVNDKTSSTQLNNFGVPQGSILGLVLFNIYIIDIVDNTSCNSLQYADDTTLYQHCKLKNLQNCIEKLESNLQTVSDWALQNSLVFNDDKTKYRLFSKQKVQP